MAKKVLITGASGLIGTRLTDAFLQKDNEVVRIGRRKKSGQVSSLVWDVGSGTIDPQVLEGVDSIVHLAGAGVADKRWSSLRKKEILDSRIKSTAVLHRELAKGNHHVRSFVSASAIGYYGMETGDKLISENHMPGRDFLAQVVQAWEEEVEKISSLGIRVVKLRTGIVLTDQGGALKSMATPIEWGVGAVLGDGKQYVSWIHIDDLCEMFWKASEDETMKGAYNAVGVQPVTNKELTMVIARVLKRPLWMPAIPAFVVRLILGEMGNMVIFGNKVSPAKIEQTGFRFQFQDLEAALRNLYKR